MTQGLTSRQEKFAQAVASGKNYSDAYRVSGYSIDKLKPDTLNRLAFAVAKNNKVSTRIAELKERCIKKLEYSAIESFEKLRRIGDAAMDRENYNAALKAEELCGKLAGLYVDKVAHTDSEGNDVPVVSNEEILKIMERRRGNKG